MPEVTANVRVSALGATQAAAEMEKVRATLASWRAASGPAGQGAATVAQNMGRISLEGPRATRAVSQLSLAAMSMVQSGSAGAGGIRSIEMGLMRMVPAGQGAAAVAQNMGRLSLEGPRATRAVSQLSFAVMSMVQSGAAGVGGIRSIQMGLMALVPGAGWALAGIAALAGGIELLSRSNAEATAKTKELWAALDIKGPELTAAQKIRQMRWEIDSLRSSAENATGGNGALRTLLTIIQNPRAMLTGGLRGGSSLLDNPAVPKMQKDLEDRIRNDRENRDAEAERTAQAAREQRAREEQTAYNRAAQEYDSEMLRRAREVEATQDWRDQFANRGNRTWLAGQARGTRDQSWDAESGQAETGLAASSIEDYANATAEMMGRIRGPMQQHWRDIAQTSAHWQLLQDRAAETGKFIGAAFGAGLQAVVAEGGGAREAARAMIKSLRDQFTMKAAGEVAASVASLAVLDFPAAAMHAKSAMLYGLAAATGGLLSGGGTAGTSTGRGESVRQSIDNRGEGTIIIMGGILDMGDPRQRDALSRAITQLSGLRSITVRSA